MYEKLKIKTIYQDFISSVSLSDEQIKILDMLIKRESIVKISMEMGMCQRTTNYEIKKLKKLYQSYCQMQLAIALLLFE